MSLKSSDFDLPNSVAFTGWQERAAIAERSILGRHLVRSFFLPCTATGVTIWPYGLKDRVTGPWHFWWQAHFIDCVIDAYEREPSWHRKKTIRRMICTHYNVNGRRWRRNEYYDDLAWIGLAVQRARNLGIIDGYGHRLRWLADRFWKAYNPKYAIPWKQGETFWNTPANAPIAIFFARSAQSELVQKARILANWMHEVLRFKEGPYEGLYADGIRIIDGQEKRIDYVFTYCQGVAIGAELELARRTGGRKQLIHLGRVCDLVEACATSLAQTDGVLTAGGGGDGGLFKGILMRYLAEVAENLPEPVVPTDDISPERLAKVKRTAKQMVFRNADAAWLSAKWLENFADEKGGVLFSDKWSRKARLPLTVHEIAEEDGKGKKVDGAVRSSKVPEQDLSTQLSGWMAIEAAARLERRGV